MASRYGWAGERRSKAGQHLVLKNPQHGVRSYLAVAGGIAVPKVLGSRSTDLKVGIGGLEGRRLQDGDRLKLGKSVKQFRRAARREAAPHRQRHPRAAGPEYQEFDSVSQDSFWRSAVAA